MRVRILDIRINLKPIDINDKSSLLFDKPALPLGVTHNPQYSKNAVPKNRSTKKSARSRNYHILRVMQFLKMIICENGVIDADPYHTNNKEGP